MLGLCLSILLSCVNHSGKEMKYNKLLKLLEPRKESYVEKTPNDVYRDVAKSTDLTPEEVAMIGGVESQHGKYRKPLAGGSARGLFQFQPETAEDLISGSSESLSDFNTQAELMKKYLERNDIKDVEDAYLKHNLGPSRAKRFIAAEDSDPVSEVISERVIESNPALYKGKTIEEAKNAIKEKLHEGKKSAKLRPSLKEILTGRK